MGDLIRVYHHDGENQLVGFTTALAGVSYDYSGHGQRIAKTTAAGSTVFFYDESARLQGEYGSQGSREYVWLDDLPVAVIDQQTNPGSSATVSLYGIESDHLATPRQVFRLTDSQVIWRWQGEAYGLTPPEEDPDGDGQTFRFNLRFPGQYYDGESGLFYNYFRYYDPATGRYVESDPIGLGGGGNTFSYVNGNPVSNSDPSGEIPIFLITGAIGGVAGFGGNVLYQLATHHGNWRCVKWGDALIAGGSGAVAGALLPLTGTSLIGAASAGAVTNAGGYLATQTANGEEITGKGIANSAAWGLVGGGIAGKFANPYWFAKGLSPWLSDPLLQAANTDALTVGRGIAGAGVGSADPFADYDCGCK